jgi:hypothetical protein
MRHWQNNSDNNMVSNSPSKNKKMLPIAILGGSIAVASAIAFFTLHGSQGSVLQADAAIYAKIPTEAGKSNFMAQSGNLMKPIDPELADLDSQIITCGASVDNLVSGNPSYSGSCSGSGGSLASTTGLYLGGQCCNAMKDTVDYHANLVKLKAYQSMPNIPLDPMHTPIAMAKYWIDYDKTTALAPDQQKVFDAAYAVSKEKPCCCKCWHYFVNEGIAKKMIVDGTFNAQQIAAFWDASDICG